ncbi:cyclic nucleotide-binding protein [Hyphomicrobium methylovorum]|uniref:Acb2/Tad1 domain-containing protein n=1 Tax=Hyphomicrobium methylovorum TaxID=84 RepID=UPI0015E7DCE2|nr:cyclic nucleotide-binding protein [Hyphomicrobium methylovorum]MBA2125094.1 cyclic nucleotide-binding protein [Hyphomicrobium methylovorum]
MTDHQPMPVKGYQPQSDDNVALANEGKLLEEQYLRWLDKLDALPTAATTQDGREAKGIDKRMVALARTNIQQGAMWAIRSIFQPKRITD